jgi:uncharacterized membrane protein YeaQ/YmgE (transglycosylase-associated protein family)
MSLKISFTKEQVTEGIRSLLLGVIIGAGLCTAMAREIGLASISQTVLGVVGAIVGGLCGIVYAVASDG